MVSYTPILFPQQKKQFCVNKIRNGLLSNVLHRFFFIKVYFTVKMSQYNVGEVLFSPQEQCVLFGADFRKTHNCSTTLSGDLVCRPNFTKIGQ
jgi:hypothetical protein